jgi:hypothetical protein
MPEPTILQRLDRLERVIWGSAGPPAMEVIQAEGEDRCSVCDGWGSVSDQECKVCGGSGARPRAAGECDHQSVTVAHQDDTTGVCDACGRRVVVAEGDMDTDPRGDEHLIAKEPDRPGEYNSLDD